MTTKRMLVLTVSGLLLSAVAAAQSAPGKCPPYPDGRKPDASPIADAIDTNKDGKLTHEEWEKAGAPEPSWNMFMGKADTKAQGYITRAQFLAETPPNGIDANCDGKITLEEFLATKKWNMGGPGAAAPQGGPPQGAPPTSGGPGPAAGGAPPASAATQPDYVFDFTPFIEEVDTNKDGHFDKQEWKAAGQYEPIFDMLDTNKDGILTVAELTARMPQKEADKNGDGKISAAELADLPNMGPKGGGAPPASGPPAAGGAPPAPAGSPQQ